MKTRDHILLPLRSLLHVALLLGSTTLWAAAVPTPCLQLLTTNTVPLGLLRGRGFTNITFQVANTGDAPLVIEKLLPTCECVTATIADTTLAPGATSILQLTLDISLVDGSFKRGLWILSNDPTQPRLPLAVTGEVIPFFNGIPATPYTFNSQAADISFTNQFTLTATEQTVTLGAPKVTGSAGAEFYVAIVTNHQENLSYDITTIVTPHAQGLHTLELTLPIIGAPNAKPVRVAFRGFTGAELTAIPRRLNFKHDEPEQHLRLVLRARGIELDPAKLSWQLPIDGLRLTTLPQAKTRPGDVTIAIAATAAACAQLQASTTTAAAITFAYPHLAPVSVECSVW